MSRLHLLYGARWIEALRAGSRAVPNDSAPVESLLIFSQGLQSLIRELVPAAKEARARRILFPAVVLMDL